MESRERVRTNAAAGSVNARRRGGLAPRFPKRGLLGVALLVGLVGSAIPPARAQAPERSGVPVQDLSGWAAQGGVTVGQDGSSARFDTGVLLAESLPAFQDGAIELEVQLTGHRAFVYVRFRDAGDGNWEEIYLRAHKSDLPDALQYTPVISFSSQWQIFHGPGGTAPIPLDVERWTRLRLEFSGSALAVFWGAAAEPALVVPRLAHAPRPGRVSLRSFIPRGAEAPFAARMRNVRVEPGAPLSSAARVALDRAEAEAGPNGPFFDDWTVGPRFTAETKTSNTLPKVEEWSPIGTEPDGKVLFHRLGNGDGIDAIVARHVVEAAEAEMRALDLGFSDAVTVFLNGRPVASLDQSYRFDAPRVQGVMGWHQARIYVPLEAGRNELHFLVTDSFGGWGLMARWSN